MPSDRLFKTLLRSLQSYTDQQDTPRLLSSATSVLLTLHNPLNLTLLTAQLLSSPAIWTRPDGLRACFRVLGIFHSAARAILQYEEEIAESEREGRPMPPPGQPVVGGGLSREEWVTAVIKGANEKSPRWRHLLVIAGILLGFESQDRGGLSRSLRSTVEYGIVTAINLALAEARNGDAKGAHCITLVLNHAFELLSDEARMDINYDDLLPVLMGSTYFSQEGYRSGYFLASVELDVARAYSTKYTWLPKSSSFHQIQEMTTRPLIATIGPLSRLIAHTVEHVKDSWLLQTTVDDLVEFAKTLNTQWRRSKLSEIDAAEESTFFDNIALTETLPVLWRLLRSALFSLVVVLRGVIGRLLQDRTLATEEAATALSTQTLQTLCYIYFISSRAGSASSTHYTFIYLTAIDILSTYPTAASSFLYSVRPALLGQIPTQPIERTHDLFFLNTAEHFTLLLTAATNEDLLLVSATPYLASVGSNPYLLQLFEAAHSVMLAVLSAPQSAAIASKHLPFYVDALFKSFPQNLSPRQFRLAFKTLLRITSPPSEVAATHPDFPATLLELLHHRTLNASDELIPQPESASGAEKIDERTTVTLALIDCLPFLPPPLLDEWLPIVAELFRCIKAPQMLESCRMRFWEVISAGEMDVERSRICVVWWGTRGGREMVLFGSSGAEVGNGMSGALPAVQQEDVGTKL